MLSGIDKRPQRAETWKPAKKAAQQQMTERGNKAVAVSLNISNDSEKGSVEESQ